MKSDKTARWCVMDEDTWQRAVSQVTEGDELEHELKNAREWQKVNEQVAIAIAAGLGVEHGLSEKVKNRLRKTPGEIPKARIMPKDHKENLGFRMIIAYGASDGGLDQIVAEAIQTVAEKKRTASDSTEIDSTEALIDSIEEVNNTLSREIEYDNNNINANEETALLLLDVVALYPSLIPSDTQDVLIEMKEELRKVEKTCIASHEAILICMAAASNDKMVTETGIMNKLSNEIRAIIPKRRSNRGRPPSYGSEKKSWIFTVETVPEQLEAEAVAFVIAIGCIRSFRSHYTINNQVYKRNGRGAIGSKSCGELAAVTMRTLDNEVKNRISQQLRQLPGAREDYEPVRDYKRYVDDITVPVRIPRGTTNEVLTRHIEQALNGTSKEHLQFTTQIVRVGEEGAALDLKLKVREDGIIMRQFYMKEFAEVKENANFSEETFRRLRNTSTGHEDQTKILEEYMARLKLIGANEQHIRRGITKGIDKYNRLKEEGNLIRNRETRIRIRNENRNERKQWFDEEGNERPLLIVEEGSKICAQRRLNKAKRVGLLRAQPGKPFVVEKHAQKEFELLAPRSTVELHCKQGLSDETCMKALNGECEGRCVTRSVVYELQCCRCKATYVGETSRSFGQRLAEHNRDYRTRKDNTWAWDHVMKEHRGLQNDFGADFKLIGNKKVTSAFRRQLMEEVIITKRKRTVGWKLLNDQLEFNSARDLTEIETIQRRN